MNVTLCLRVLTVNYSLLIQNSSGIWLKCTIVLDWNLRSVWDVSFPLCLGPQNVVDSIAATTVYSRYLLFSSNVIDLTDYYVWQWRLCSLRFRSRYCQDLFLHWEKYTGSETGPFCFLFFPANRLSHSLTTYSSFHCLKGTVCFCSSQPFKSCS